MKTGDAKRTSLPLVALGLGVFGDQMLAVPFGLGTALGIVVWVGAFVATHREELDRSRLAAAAAALTAAVGLAWRDSPTLHALDIFLLLASCGFLATGDDASARRSSASRTGSCARPCSPPSAACALMGRIPWNGVRNGRFWRLALSAAGGLLVAFPIVLIFTILLANADPIFGQRLEQLFSFEISEVVRHVIVAAALSWFAAGFLYAGESTAAARPARPSWLATGALEVAVVLTLVDLLFGGFVWVQVRYLFGSREWVDTVAGLTYSQYARRGFFELVTVTALALPLLLVAHWLVRPHARGRRVVLALAGVQVALVLVMLVSAMERMRLYQAEYGQTELRFYTTAFMLWLAVLLGSFLLTVLPGRRDLFAYAAVPVRVDGGRRAARRQPRRADRAREPHGAERLRRAVRADTLGRRGAGARRDRVPAGPGRPRADRAVPAAARRTRPRGLADVEPFARAGRPSTVTIDAPTLIHTTACVTIGHGDEPVDRRSAAR